MVPNECLAIPDVLDVVMQHLDSGKSLRKMALVSPQFSEAALRALWKNYGDLEDWLHFLPEDTLAALSCDPARLELCTQLRFKDQGPVGVPAAGLLRKITLSKSFDDNVLENLHTIFPLHTFFPNIHSLDLRRPPSRTNIAQILLRPQLLEISLRSSSLEEMDVILEPVPMICPGLQRLRFESSRFQRDEPERVTDALASLLSQCNDLRSVYCCSVFFDQADLNNLGAFANLHTLKWAWDDRGPLKVFEGNMPPRPLFPRLRHYYQSYMSNFSSFINLAGLITSPKLQTVDLTCNNICPERLKELFRVMNTNLDHAALEEIRVIRFTWRFIPVENLGRRPTTIKTLLPLFKFKNLRTLVINDTGTHRRPIMFDFDDITLGHIASNFRRLETLILGFGDSDDTWIHPYKVTLSGLLTLVTHCPKLQELHLKFNFCTIDPPIFNEDFAGRCPDLHTLKVFDSPIDHGVEMGAILARLFPKPPKLSFDTSVRRSQWHIVNEVFTRL